MYKFPLKLFFYVIADSEGDSKFHFHENIWIDLINSGYLPKIFTCLTLHLILQQVYFTNCEYVQIAASDLCLYCLHRPVSQKT